MEILDVHMMVFRKQIFYVDLYTNINSNIRKHTLCIKVLIALFRVVGNYYGYYDISICPYNVVRRYGFRFAGTSVFQPNSAVFAKTRAQCWQAKKNIIPNAAYPNTDRAQKGILRKRGHT